MTREGLRLLHLPNETVPGKQVGSREAFTHLHREGVLSAYEAYSFIWEAKQTGSVDAARTKLMETAQRFGPDIIFWQHISHFDVSREFLRRLKALPSRPKIVYHEADPYGPIFQRVTTPMQALFAEADLVFMVGMGDFSNLARKYGARRVLYAPHNVDQVRFGTPWEPTLEREYDLVMIGNLGTTRIPGVFRPGARARRTLVRRAYRRFGSSFAVYGSGWQDVPSAKGKTPFETQEEVIRSSWLSINWDHFSRSPYYFSNRLPISLAAGVPHITTHHNGYDQMFRHCEGLFYARSVDEALDTASWLLSLPKEELIRLGREGRQFALANFSSRKVYSDLVGVCAYELLRDRSDWRSFVRQPVGHLG